MPFSVTSTTLRSYVRAVNRKEIASMGHAKSLDTSADMGAYVAAHVVGTDVDENGCFLN